MEGDSDGGALDSMAIHQIAKLQVVEWQIHFADR